MIIRQAVEADAHAICGIANAIIRDSLVTFTTDERTPEAFAADIRERGAAFLVAEKDGTIAGFATYGPFRKGPGYAHTKEHSIQVADGLRGGGVGSALMDRIESIAAAHGVHVLVAGISSANPRSVTFHARHGFVEVARMPQVGRKNGQWLDLILMQKILTETDRVAESS